MDQDIIYKGGPGILSISEYRRILGDNKSSDEIIQKRITYLEALCRNVIKIEIEKYVKSKKN